MALHLSILAAMGALLAGPTKVNVVWRGCSTDRAGPACELASAAPVSTLSISFPQTLELVAQIDGTHSPVAMERVVGDVRLLEVQVPPSAGELRLVDPRGQVVWALELRPERARPVALAQVQALADAGDWSGVRAEMTAWVARYRIDPPAGASPEDLAEALDLLRRAEFRLPGGALEQVLAYADEARTIFREVGAIDRACDLDQVVFALSLDRRRDVAAAGAAADELRQCAQELPRYAWLSAYDRARLAEAGGDPASALLHYRDARRAAEQVPSVGDALDIASSEYALADALHRDDLIAEVEALRRDSEDAIGSMDPCTRATRYNNFGWARLRRRERGRSTSDPRPDLLAALLVFTAEPRCRSAHRADNVRINLAFDALQAGDWSGARIWLQQTDARRLGPDEQLWAALLGLRAALALKDMKAAERSVRALESLAASRAEPEYAWHAAVSRGELTELGGDLDEALRSYRRAESLREALGLSLAAGLSLERAATDWERGARRMVELQLRTGDVPGALCTARLARGRPLRAIVRQARLQAAGPEVLAALRREQMDLQQRLAADMRLDAQRTGSERRAAEQERRLWPMRLLTMIATAGEGAAAESCESLRAPAPGELLLTYYPLSDDRFLAFAAGADGIHTAEVMLPAAADPRLRSAALLGPFDREIAAANDLRVVASGALLAVDLHALPWRGRPLLARRVVAYALDLPRSGRPPTSGARDVLAVVDPDRDLVHLSEEMEQVLSAWDREGAPPVVVDEGEDPDGLLSSLSGARVFHFAGHGARPEDRGMAADNWLTALRFSEGRALAVHDVLTLDRAPDRVFLSACSTGATDPSTLTGGMSVARALAVRGSEVVIAASRPVGDEPALLLAMEIYRGPESVLEALSPAGLRRAQAVLLGERDCEASPDICAYRAWTP